MWTLQYAAVIRTRSGGKNVKKLWVTKMLMVDENTKSLLSPLIFFFITAAASQNLFIFIFMFADEAEGFVDGVPHFSSFFFFLQIIMKKAKTWTRPSVSCSLSSNDSAANNPGVRMVHLIRCRLILKICIHIPSHSGLLRCHFLPFYGSIYRQRSIGRYRSHLFTFHCLSHNQVPQEEMPPPRPLESALRRLPPPLEELRREAKFLFLPRDEKEERSCSFCRNPEGALHSGLSLLETLSKHRKHRKKQNIV